ncbi:DUF1460 domain-containing protein [Zeaxanthinibacter sp. PT1]|uniref:N-acetylmuramoyl-L-alanine amidase-like domain-containing protein n=1 Tax=Zeaxanthinibacter TaxID=561554 RepID=UPI00234A4A89|nr:N-acetylmuramoyl-L-alanine amidase-like domain-containing protein [Zeaxanthinibacter sp. PT1]MDC6350509.1 DUF1460 domain-containing protein [Zeaxanthinibacter sp. PT1]
MKKLLIPILFLLGCTTSWSQAIVCSDADRQKFEEKVQQLHPLIQDDYGQTLVAIGKTFMGTPYVAKTLEVGDKESLVVNLHGLDCTTFVENVLAFGILKEQGTRSFHDYTDALETIRYRDGALDGYGSRLHYFTDWIADNEAKGLVKDITGKIGGVIVSKPINFMSTHRDLYPLLADDANYEQVKAAENRLNSKELCVLPQEAIAKNESNIQSGDIIALATSIDGLDVTHTGIATREADGRIHLLHASTGSMEVEVSALPLADYLKKVNKNTGIIVVRPLKP